MTVGLDLLEVDRLEAALARRPRLAERLFSDGERAYAASRARPIEHLAARFCAKEAVTKALGLDAFAPRDICVEGGGNEHVGLALTGRPAARAQELGVRVAISMTHTRVTAGCVATLERTA